MVRSRVTSSRPRLRRAALKLLVALLAAELVLRGIEVAHRTWGELVHRPAAAAGSSRRLLFVGGCQIQHGWPTRLKESLAARGVPDAELVNLGQARPDLQKMARDFPDRLARHRPRVVVCMFPAPLGRETASAGFSLLPDETRVYRRSRALALAVAGARQVAFRAREAGLRLAEAARPGGGAVLRRTRLYLETGRRDLAVDALRTHLRRRPEAAAVWRELGQLLRADGLPDEADAAFVRAGDLFAGFLKGGPEDYDFLLPAAWCYGQTDATRPRARELVRRALALRPAGSEGYRTALALEDAQNDEDESAVRAVCWEWIRRAPDDPRPFVRLLTAYPLRTPPGPAEASELAASIERYLEARPREAGETLNLHLALADFHRLRGRHREALAGYQRVIDLEPRQHQAYVLSGITCHALGDEAAARRWFERADAVRFPDEDIRAYRAAYNRLKRLARAQGAEFVVVAYPFTGVDWLKHVLAPADGVRFVDLDDLFKGLVLSSRYDEFFWKEAVGRCLEHPVWNPQANRLIADRVADVVAPLLRPASER
jgi:tetratricopeptide (TPR) repeat protein